jgi:hypothetical protein
VDLVPTGVWEGVTSGAVTLSHTAHRQIYKSSPTPRSIHFEDGNFSACRNAGISSLLYVA